MILSIVIANWNTRGLIKQCVESVFNTTGSEPEYEIIVIDNASTDGSVEYLRSLGGKITLIENSVNEGYAKACNAGIKAAAGKYVLLLGSDTIMKPGTLKRCVMFLEENPGCGAAGCRLLNPDGSIQNSCKRFPLLKNAFYTYLSLGRLNAGYDMAEFGYDKTTEVEQIDATFLMIRKPLLEKIDYFDESYGILYNDVDLCRKINDLGLKIFFIHDAEIIHYGSHSTKMADFALRKKMYGDIYRYYKKNFGFKARFLYPILVFRLLVVSSIKS